MIKSHIFGEISIQSPESNEKINSGVLSIQEDSLRATGQDSAHELIANEYKVVVANHELTPMSTDWTIPNSTKSQADIEHMDWWQKHRLINDVPLNILSFRGSELENNEELYNDLLYNNRVVGRIDQQHLNQVSITDNTITITNPHNSLVLSDHDIQWCYL